MDLHKVLVINIDSHLLETLKRSLTHKGYEIQTAKNGQEGLKFIRSWGPKLILMGSKKAGTDGMEVVKDIKRLDNEAEIIVITDRDDTDSALLAIQQGASDFISKPVRDEILLLALERAKSKITISQQLRDYTDNLEHEVKECMLDLKQAEDELIKSERLATIGETVAGLAHYIKNILSGLRGGTYMVNRGLDGEKPDMLREGWDMVQRNVERISELALDLLGYSKERTPEPSRCEPNEIVREVVDLYRERARENDISLAAVLDDNLQTAFTDKNGLHRILLNLVSNAIDACIDDPDEEKDWKVTIKTKLERENQPEPMFLIIVTDTGIGMTEEVKAKLFSRFFSTKGGRGTGLGLLVTQKIIKELGAEINVTSAAGKGTTFSVRLKLEMASYREESTGR